METIAVCCWLAAEVHASARTSAPCYCCAENIGVVAIVAAELKFGQVQRQIFLAHVVIGADDSALEQRPERFDVVRVNQAAHVLALTMSNRLMRESLPAIQIVVARVLVGRDQFNLAAHSLGYEPMERR